MTRDVAAQAVHERLESFVAKMLEPDVEAGWAALVAQLEPPVAPVVPLRRRPRPRRAIVLGVAAAVLIGGSALAVVRHGGNDGQPSAVHPPSAAPRHAGIGSHTHPSLSRPASTHHGEPPGSTGGHPHAGTGSTTGSPSNNHRSGGGATSGSSGDHTSHTFHHDSPNDTDHGTGNDVHGDNGQGNNTQGQDTQGDGSSGGSGNDQGLGGDQGSSNQGSSNRGGHATGGGEHPTTGGGSDGGHGSSGQGQGGGQGSHG